MATSFNSFTGFHKFPPRAAAPAPSGPFNSFTGFHVRECVYLNYEPPKKLSIPSPDSTRVRLIVWDADAYDFQFLHRIPQARRDAGCGNYILCLSIPSPDSTTISRGDSEKSRGILSIPSPDSTPLLDKARVKRVFFSFNSFTGFH